MSVKDRIAMWNSMSTNSNTNNNNSNPPKATQSVQIFKPQQQEPPRPNPTDSPYQKHHVQTASIVKPSDLKKKQMEQSQPVNKAPQYVVKLTQTSYKAPEPIKKQNPAQNTSNNITVQSPTVPKPSDIKKQLQQQISGNTFHIMAPPIKKVESITIQPKENVKEEYEIERDVPVVSVKQSAEKLGMFYQKKAEEQSKPKEVIAEVHEQIKHEQKRHQQQFHLPQQEEPILMEEKYVPQTESQFILPPQQQTPTEVKQQSTSQETDLAVRLKNRNKKKRQNFDSDDD